MIKALADLDPRTAAGILARMALALDGNADNPDARSMGPDDEAIRQRVLEELRSRFALDNRDDETAVKQLYQALDEESDRLLGLQDPASALERLSERGELPSDRYVVELDAKVRDFPSKLGLPLEREEELIRLTVREPHAEQHYGPRISDDRPSLASLFARRFEHRYPQHDFILLVLGFREGTILKVHVAWRVYPAVVNLYGAATLVEMVQRFAESFGNVVTVGNQTGKFILWARLPRMPDQETPLMEMRTSVPNGESVLMVSLQPYANKIDFRVSGLSKSFAGFLFFKLSADEPIVDVAFAMAIDTDAYRRALSRFGALKVSAGRSRLGPD